MMLRDVCYFVKNWWNASHHIPTGLRIGRWHDKVELMTEGLLELVDDYVSKDKEDAFSIVDYNHVHPEPDYRDFLETVRDVKAKIIDVLHFKHVRKPKLEREINLLMHELYGSDDWLEKLRREFTPAERAKSNLIRKFETDLYNETQRVLHMIVDIRTHLWS
jgi:hypothetical protein